MRVRQKQLYEAAARDLAKSAIKLKEVANALKQVIEGLQQAQEDLAWARGFSDTRISYVFLSSSQDLSLEQSPRVNKT